jgi:hypothetical protein
VWSVTDTRCTFRALLNGWASPDVRLSRSLPYRGAPALQRAALVAAAALSLLVRQAAVRACWAARLEATVASDCDDLTRELRGWQGGGRGSTTRDESLVLRT